MPSPRVHLPIVAIALIVGSVACSSAKDSSDAAPGDDTAAASATSPTSATTTLIWADCDDDLECATLTVPLDPGSPGGRQVDIAVARRRATDPEQRIGALLVNPGGPGGSGVDWLRSSRPLPEELRRRFDVVSWDPRGVGASTAPDCAPDEPGFVGLDPTPDTADEQAAIDATAAAEAAACGRADADLLAHMGTSDAVDDLEALRAALGEQQISYLGFSYGTLIGQEYAAAHPDRLRALVLDGVIDPAETLEEWLTGQATALEGWLAELGGDYDRLAERLEREPMTAEGREVGPDALVLAAIASSYDESGHAHLRRALDDALDGDARRLLTLADLYTGSLSSYVGYLGVLCTDGPHPVGATGWRAMADRLAAVAPRMGAPVAYEIAACATWSAAPKRTPAPVTATTIAPALVVGNLGDAATPIDDARRVAQRLPGSVLLTYEGQGHTATTTHDCVADAVVRYLVELDLPATGTACPVDAS